MIEKVLKTQRRSRNGIAFFSIMARSEGCKRLRKIKATRDSRAIDSEPLIQAVIRFVSVYAIRGGYGVITVPPASSEGVSWAGDIAERISEATGIPYEVFFRPHGMGKRCYLGAKFRPITFSWAIEPERKRVLVFDDFSMTNITITETIREIRSKGMDCEGLVICV
ncbi:MAG: hypothetical protein AB1457_16215 [Chloroflexota bacterium]